MAVLPVVAVPVAGGVNIDDSTQAAAGGGDSAPVGPGRFLYVANGDASSHTVTIATPGTVAGLDISNATVTVPAGEAAVIPLTAVFRGTNGRAAITYDGVTSVTVACFELGT